jgi:hypothetical protein
LARPTSLAVALHRRGALLLPPALLLGGCPSPSAPTGAPQGGEFTHDPSCTLTGSLSVALGDGADGFVALTSGQGPVEQFGPQGGTHAFAAVQIGGLALDRYDIVLLQLSLFTADQCPETDAPCDGDATFGVGAWVLGDTLPLEPIDAHTIEQDQLRIEAGAGPIVLQAQVEDPCGQVGFAQQPFVR